MGRIGTWDVGPDMTESLETIVETNRPPEVPVPCPCTICGSGLFWQDPYAARHCAFCRPPPADALVRSVWTVIVLDSSAEKCYEWEENDPLQIGPPRDVEVKSPHGPSVYTRIEPDGYRVTYLAGYRWVGPPPGEKFEDWWNRQPTIPD